MLFRQKGAGKAGRGFKSPTLVKTCEETKLIRECRSPQDWALLALQNVRTGKSQYLVICRCEQGELGKNISNTYRWFDRRFMMRMRN